MLSYRALQILLKMLLLPQTEDSSSVGQHHLGDSFWHPPSCQVADLLGVL